MLAALQDFNATGARDPFPSALGGSGLSQRRRGARVCKEAEKKS
jgi:hypothetical protein